MSARSPRGRMLPLVTGLALAAVSAIAMPAVAAVSAHASSMPWWLTRVNASAGWHYSRGSGVTVAVLSTGVDAAHPDLTGSVTTGPDESRSGREPGGPFWGIEGTGVASLVAGRDGVAPDARILSLRVTLEYNDPLNSDTAITRHLPDAIAAGITYAVTHGAQVIDLPLDPGTLGLNAAGRRGRDPAAAGGSAAEATAVADALAHGVVLVAPAGDDGASADTVNHPAAYEGVIAVGAITRAGGLAPYSSHHSYVALLAPGSGLAVATPPSGSTRLSTTDNSAALVAGVAALIRSRYPRLTVAQVIRALERGGTSGARGRAGTGFGVIDAGRALRAASLLADPRTATRPDPAPTTPATRQEHKHSSLAARLTNPDGGAGSLLKDIVLALGVVIVLLGVILLAARARRDGGAPKLLRGSPQGTHARGARRSSGNAPADPWRGSRITGSRPAGLPASGRRAASDGRPASGGRPARPVIAPVAKSSKPAIRGAARPPWEPAPAPADARRPPGEVVGLFPSARPLPPSVSVAEPVPAAFERDGKHRDGQERGSQDRGGQERGSQERGGQERGGQERYREEPFAAAPVPMDVPDWSYWSPTAPTEAFPAVPDENSPERP